MINVQVVKCKHCSTVITSRAHHDFNSCRCGMLKVDGGFFDTAENTQKYTRIIGAFQREDMSVIKDLPVTEAELYEDWSKNLNEFKDLTKYAL